KTLGDERGVMIRNHGVVVVGESVMRAVYSTITLRDNAKALINAFALGSEIHYMGYEECKEATWLQFVKVGMQRSWNFWCTNAKKAYDDIAHIEHLR
ncbi:MAG: hypothetical protein GX847_01210, partial [Clostridiales bacterium]|nr:hypothetical protein [Clostridiales bacterium]